MTDAAILAGTLDRLAADKRRVAAAAQRLARAGQADRKALRSMIAPALTDAARLEEVAALLRKPGRRGS
ncbi:MAG: hypothetical protein JJ902_22705 [Roseibium sp.]|nr:hypothetical protein [Roseibium sp.]